MKMKRYIPIAIVIVLICATIIIALQYIQTSTSTIASSVNEFDIHDTAAITAVFIANHNGDRVTLKRKKMGGWSINDAYTARPRPIHRLLETLYLMRIKAPVSKSRYDKTIRDLSTMATKVEVYQGGSSPSKVFYIGTTNQQHTGNYMLIEGSTKPYLIHIEGFNGFLNPRFSVHENDWRDRTIFSYDPKDIAQIKLTFPGEPDKGFVITQSIDSKFSLYNTSSDSLTGWDTGYIFQYISRFRTVNFEMWEESKSIAFMDSVRESTPLEIYAITDRSGKETTVKTFLKPLTNGIEIDGTPIDNDQDRMYGVIDDQQCVIIQYFVFDPLQHKIDYFFQD